MRFFKALMIITAMAVFYYLPGQSLADKISWLRGLPDKVPIISSEAAPREKVPKEVAVKTVTAPRVGQTNVSNTITQSKTQDKVKTEESSVVHVRDSKSLAMEKEIFNVINEERKRLGLEPFLWDDKVAEMARLKSIEAFEIKLVTHKSPKYGYAMDMYHRYGVPFKESAEVLDYGTSGFFNSKAIVEDWFKSPSHREILTSPTLKYIGVGLVWAEKPVVLKDGLDGTEIPAVYVVNGLLYAPKQP
ncbi:MAG: CAP domain-containing protein [Candidatus Hadarchaeum sp.]